MGTVDVLLLPTTGNIYTIAEVEAEPEQLNTNSAITTNSSFSWISVPGLFPMVSQEWSSDGGYIDGARISTMNIWRGLPRSFITSQALPWGLQDCLAAHIAPEVELSSSPGGERMEPAVLGLHLTVQPLNSNSPSWRPITEDLPDRTEYLCYVITDLRGRASPVRPRQDGSGAGIEVKSGHTLKILVALWYEFPPPLG